MQGFRFPVLRCAMQKWQDQFRPVVFTGLVSTHKDVVWWSSPRLSVHIILLLLASAEYSLDTPFKIICVELVSSHAPVHLETLSSCTNMTFT